MGLIQIPVIKFIENGDEEVEEEEEDLKIVGKQEKEVADDDKPKSKSKLGKLKEKIKQKQKEKLAKTEQNDDEKTDFIKLKKPNNIANDNESEDDFLVPKNKSESIDPSKINFDLKVSNNQLKKVNIDGGIFNGRNKIMFDTDGKKIN